MAAMVSLAFHERDTREIVRKASRLLDPSSPYRKCLDLVISLAESGKSFQEVVNAVEDRWHMEYPATNNAVPNGGIAAAGVWFGEGDFLKTVNLVASAADFTDADCNAANAAAVVGAMNGLKAIPQHLVAALHDRIRGEKMGPVTLTPSVDESISELARRTVAIGEKVLVANGARLEGDTLRIPVAEPKAQPAEIFNFGDLMQYWNPDWTLERAGAGGAGGGMGGIRGNTHLDGDILATYPRDEVRALVLRRTMRIPQNTKLRFDAGADAGRAWELNAYAGNTLLEKRIVEGGKAERQWQQVEIDLQKFAGQTVQLRLYQRVLVKDKTAGNALWRGLRVD